MSGNVDQNSQLADSDHRNAQLPVANPAGLLELGRGDLGKSPEERELVRRDFAIAVQYSLDLVDGT